MSYRTKARLEFTKMLAAKSYHPIVTHHYASAIKQSLERRSLHPLQRLMIEREAALDIPYMN